MTISDSLTKVVITDLENAYIDYIPNVFINNSLALDKWLENRIVENLFTLGKELSLQIIDVSTQNIIHTQNFTPQTTYQYQPHPRQKEEK